MKKLIFIIILCLPMGLFAQRVNNVSTGAALIDTSSSNPNNDSAFVTIATGGGSPFRGVKAFRSSTLRDTVTTNWIKMEGGNGDISFEFAYENLINRDSLNVVFQAFRGYGITDSLGITEHSLETFSKVNDTTKAFFLADSAFVFKRLFTRYRFRIFELSAQSNDYIISINQYSPNNERMIILR